MLTYQLIHDLATNSYRYIDGCNKAKVLPQSEGQELVTSLINNKKICLDIKRNSNQIVYTWQER